MNKLILVLLFILVNAERAFPQIVDDTTQLVNGYNNTIFIRANEIIASQTKGHRLDTSINELQESDEYLYADGERQKNLGFIGSPQQSLFYKHIITIGRQLGNNNTQYLSFDPDSIRFFRNYNVYSKIKYNQGSYGRQWIQVEASKNIKSNINVGFALRRLTSQKQIGVSTYREKQADQTAYTLNFNASLFGNHYFILSSFSNFSQTLVESGGIWINPSLQEVSANQLYDFDVALTQFVSNGISNEKRRNFRIYNVIRIDSLLPHIVINTGFSSYRYDYKIGLNTSNPRLQYMNQFLSSDTSRSAIHYDMININPSIQKLIGNLFLEVSANYRLHRYSNLGLNVAKLVEPVYTARARLAVSLGTVEAEVASIPGRDKFIGGMLNSNWVFAKASFSKISPTFLSQRLVSNNFQWNNNFSLENISNIEVGITPKSKFISGEISVRNQVIVNGIFYSQFVNPVQIANAINSLSAKARAILTVKKFNWDVQIQSATSNRQDLLPQPKFFIRSTPSFLFSFKKGRYQVMPGIEAWYRTSFYGQAYEPSLGLFYLQDQSYGQLNSGFPKHQQLDSYLWTSIFINIKINNTNGFIKLGNATQDLLGPGFFDVAFYPGQRRYFEFGIDWTFFD